MTTLIAIYLAVGFFSYWPAIYFWLDGDEIDDVKWWHWGMAWATWCVCWPIRYAQDVWYSWRAKK